VKPGEIANYELQVKNNGNGPESMKITPLLLKSLWSVTYLQEGIPIDEIRLQPGEQRTYTVALKVPGSELADTYQSFFQLTTDNWNTTFQLSTRVLQIYAIQLTTDISKQTGTPGGTMAFLIVVKNNGNGTFQPPVNYAAGDIPTSVFCADLDGDADLDLAVANQNSRNVSIHGSWIRGIEGPALGGSTYALRTVNALPERFSLRVQSPFSGMIRISSGRCAVSARGSLAIGIRNAVRGISTCATIPSACTPVSVRLELCRRGWLGKSFASASSTFSTLTP
jgi:hypothetical protein